MMPDILYAFTTMSFQAPLMLLMPLLIWFCVLTRKPQTIGAPYPSQTLLKVLPQPLRVRMRGILRRVLATIFVVTASIAAARPQRVSIIEAVDSNRNIMLAIDVSPSMAARDFEGLIGRSTRLTAVKNVVGTFIEERTEDRLGLVVFGGEAYLQSPLTLDHSLVKELVARLEVGMAGEGTALGDGLGVAVKRVRALPANSSSIILLTDGVSNSGQVNPIKAAKVARDLGIKVHTIGVGSDREVNVLRPGNIFSNFIERRVEFDEETLKQIAELTGGVYFSATDLSELEKVYREIDALERSEREEEKRLYAQELFIPYATTAFLAYALYVMLSLTIFLRIPE